MQSRQPPHPFASFASSDLDTSDAVNSDVPNTSLASTRLISASERKFEASPRVPRVGSFSVGASSLALNRPEQIVTPPPPPIVKLSGTTTPKAVLNLNVDFDTSPPIVFNTLLFLDKKSPSSKTATIASTTLSEATMDSLNQEIRTWIVPHKVDVTTELAADAYVIKFTPDYYDRLVAVSKKLRIDIAIRVQDKNDRRSHRRNSLVRPDTKTVIGTGKYPPITAKTNVENLLYGLIARRRKLQEKPISNFASAIAGAWPDPIKDAPDDIELRSFLQARVPNNTITQAKYWFNMICFEEEIPSYALIGDQLVEIGMMKKYFIQAHIRIYLLIDKIIADQTLPGNDTVGYKFIAATNYYLMFKYNGETFKINLDTLMPPGKLPTDPFKQFKNIYDFRKYAKESRIIKKHGLIWVRNEDEIGDFSPEMVWCGTNGHIIGDADPQHFGKRFDMPRIAYATFDGPNPLDHEKFIIGLELFRARLLCTSGQQFIATINKLREKYKFLNINDYMTEEEVYADDKYYTNYMDPSPPNADRFRYYQGIILPMIENTIKKYNNEPDQLWVVCHSDLYSLIVQVEIGHPQSIHAPEESNLKPGVIGVQLFCEGNLLFVTENEQSMLAALFRDRDILRRQVIVVNPYYTREREGKEQALSKQWLDVIIIRCLHAARMSDFEFRMHWLCIARQYDLDTQYGSDANKKLNEILSKLRNKIGDDSVPREIREARINYELDSIYSRYIYQTLIFSEKLLESETSFITEVQQEPEAVTPEPAPSKESLRIFD